MAPLEAVKIWTDSGTGHRPVVSASVGSTDETPVVPASQICTNSDCADFNYRWYQPSNGSTDGGQ